MVIQEYMDITTGIDEEQQNLYFSLHNFSENSEAIKYFLWILSNKLMAHHQLFCLYYG